MEKADKSFLKELERRLYGLTKFKILKPEEEKIEEVLKQIKELQKQATGEDSAKNSKKPGELTLKTAEDEERVMDFLAEVLLFCGWKHLEDYGIVSVTNYDTNPQNQKNKIVAFSYAPKWFQEKVEEKITLAEEIDAAWEKLKKSTSELVDYLKSNLTIGYKDINWGDNATDNSQEEEEEETLDKLDEMRSFLFKEHKEKMDSVLTEVDDAC
jgi:hypothetical protein